MVSFSEPIWFRSAIKGKRSVRQEWKSRSRIIESMAEVMETKKISPFDRLGAQITSIHGNSKSRKPNKIGRLTRELVDQYHSHKGLYLLKRNQENIGGKVRLL